MLPEEKSRRLTWDVSIARARCRALSIAGSPRGIYTAMFVFNRESSVADSTNDESSSARTDA